MSRFVERGQSSPRPWEARPGRRRPARAAPAGGRTLGRVVGDGLRVRERERCNVRRAATRSSDQHAARTTHRQRTRALARRCSRRCPADTAPSSAGAGACRARARRSPRVEGAAAGRNRSARASSSSPPPRARGAARSSGAAPLGSPAAARVPGPSPGGRPVARFACFLPCVRASSGAEPSGTPGPRQRRHQPGFAALDGNAQRPQRDERLRIDVLLGPVLRTGGSRSRSAGAARTP